MGSQGGMTHFAPLPRLNPVPAHVAVTLRLTDPASDVLVRHVRLLRDCVALAQQRWEFGIDAAVVLPAEVQLLCGFSDAEFGVNGAIRLIKSAFCRHLPEPTADIWADDDEKVEIAVPVVPLRRTFMENAPVRAGLVRHAEDWPYSSAHRSSALASPLGVAVA